MSRHIVVLDLDGTLVDSAYQHVAAWAAAFQDVGLRISSAQLHQAIGMAGDRLVPHVAGDAAEWAVGDQVRQAQATHFKALLPSISELDGASDLITELVRRGHLPVLASSSEQDVIEDLLAHVEARSALVGVVSGAGTMDSKPDPDLIDAAIAEAGSGPTVAVGDTVWDMLASHERGVPAIGLRSGGITTAQLREAGASWVYDDPRDLLEHLDEVPLLG